MGIRDYLSDLTRSGAIRGAIGRAFRKRRRGADDSVRVLVVVSDPALRDAIVAALRHPAYAVQATSAREALPLCASHDPDVVLVDVAQPSHGEAELLSTLRRQRPATATIALVPRLPGAPAGDSSLVADADATVHTPFDTPTLLDTLERVLGAS